MTDAIVRRYPTDLTEVEAAHADRRRRELAETFAQRGELTDARWRAAFERTARHPYVPAFYVSTELPPVLSTDPDRRGEWLDAVYSDRTLVTKVVPVSLGRSLAPATGQHHVSSSTLPSLMLQMLDLLDVADGHRVLEIGTGSGYNAALLCERLGDRYVTTMDVDSELVELAVERLAANGHRPVAVTADGADGCPDGAPYDRILSTCAVPAIPPQWLAQTAPNGVILTDLQGRIGGTLLRITADGEGGGEGRFVPFAASFMWMRGPEPSAVRSFGPRGDVEHSVTGIDPGPLSCHSIFAFVAQWHLPDADRGLGVSTRGNPAVHLGAADGSHCAVELEPSGEGHRVEQSGPRRLWDVVESAHAMWDGAGRPGYERFGVSITATEQHVWLDDPQGPHRWPLPGSSNMV